MSHEAKLRLSAIGPIVSLLAFLTTVAGGFVAWGSSQATLTAMRDEQRQLALDVRSMIQDVATAKATYTNNDRRLTRLEDRVESIVRR